MRQDLDVDKATEILWRRAQPPFDGQTLHTELLPTPMLLRGATALIAVVERHTTCRQLRTFDDWHEHDGYQKEGCEANWGDLTAALSSEAQLRESSPDDDLVRRAWLANDDSFYLRWFRTPPSHVQLGCARRTIQRRVGTSTLLPSRR
jgi:hypothetical protein